MRIYVGSDHAGFEYRNTIIQDLREKDYEVIECAYTEYNRDDDYVDAALEVSEKVANDNGSFGILICGTGIGMSIVANRRAGIRAAACHNEYEARLTRMHNDANILCLGERTIGKEVARELVNVFITTSFDNAERNIRRIEKINNASY